MQENKVTARSEMPFYIVSLAIIVCRLAASYVFSSFDDAFITYRYAANLVRGLGLVYNQHEKVLGTTAPLFALVCAIPAFLSISIPKFILVFNICCDLLSFRIIKKHLFAESTFTALVFGFLFAADPASNRISVGGMEANLFFLCSIFAIYLFQTGRRYPAYAIAAVIYFLRPEAVILLGLLVMFDWRQNRKFPTTGILLCIAIVSLPLFSIFLYYGQLLPQSVIAKNQQGVNPFISLVKSVFFSTPLSFVIFPLAVFGGFIAFKVQPAFRIIIIWISAYAAAYLIRGPWILNWYIYSIAVAELMLAGIALQKIIVLLRLKISAIGFSSMAGLGAMVIWAFVVLRLGRSGVETNVFSPLKRDFGDGRARNRIFFADDIGALGFYTDAYIYDDLMLVTPQAAQYPNAAERIVHLKPDFLFLYADRRYMGMMAADSNIFRHYQFVKRYARSGETACPSPDSIGAEYKQDFILLKRTDLK